jgi:lipoprotein-anchoring transpeptidase ErfK/SrfK
MSRPTRAVLAVVAASALGATACGAPARDHAQPTTPVVVPSVAGPPLLAAVQTTPAAPTTSASATPTPESTPCTSNRRDRLVFVSIRRQQMWMCAKHRVAYSTPITSGMVGQYTGTPTGTYRVQGLNRNTTLTLNTGATYPVKYWIPFDAPLFGFHDSAWQRFPYGSPRYRTQGSHGCVHMPLAAIRFLYGWADIGTTVRIKA